MLIHLNGKLVAKEEAKVLELTQGVLDGLGKNGKRPTAGAATKTGPQTLEEIESAMLDPSTSVKDLPGLQKQRDKLLGR